MTELQTCPRCGFTHQCVPANTAPSHDAAAAAAPLIPAIRLETTACAPQPQVVLYRVPQA